MICLRCGASKLLGRVSTTAFGIQACALSHHSVLELYVLSVDTWSGRARVERREKRITLNVTY